MLPIEEHGFALHIGAFCTVFAMWMVAHDQWLA